MWFFRLPAWAYLVIAPLGLAFAGFMYFDDAADEAAKKTARAGQAPAAVNIEAFDRARNTGPADEVTVIGQVDVSKMMDLTRSKKGVERDRWTMAPIYPTTAQDTKAPAIGLLIQKGPVSDAQLSAMVVGEGRFGPLMKLNGFLLSPGAEDNAVREMSAKVAVTETALHIDPFEAGRAEGLKPDTSGREVAIIFVIASLLIAAFGGFRLMRERRRVG